MSDGVVDVMAVLSCVAEGGGRGSTTKVIVAGGTSGLLRIGYRHGPLVGGDCACCSTHLGLEILTLGVVGTGMARTNCWLSGLFRSE